MTVRVLVGDCLQLLPELDAESLDSCCTDPPYGLGFMAREWDHGVPGPPFWEAVRRVLRPGAHLLAFGGTRTFHRLTCAIEDGGFEIRDCLMWLYGAGFPKSHNLDGDWDGWGTALKPAWEPVIMARVPFKGSVAQNVLRHGTGAINVDGCRVEPLTNAEVARSGRSTAGMFASGGVDWKRDGAPAEGRWPANLCLDSDAAEMLDQQSGETVSNDPGTTHVQAAGWGHSAERRNKGYAGDSGGASRFFYTSKASKAEREKGLTGDRQNVNDGRQTSIDNPYQRGDTPRLNTHPTVKPLDLMQWLVRLVTPKGGTVLDPFCGSGSTLIAADRERFNAIGIEIDPDYAKIARDRCRGDCPMFAEVL